MSESEGNATWLHRQLWQWQGISEVDRREGKPGMRETGFAEET